MDLTVVVGTYGHTEWKHLARSRAIPSAEALGVPVVHVHGETLAGARNAALTEVRTPLVVFLDADDELEPGYVEAMLAADGDIRVPCVRFLAGDHWQGLRLSSTRTDIPKPVFPRVVGHRHTGCVGECLNDGNFIVIGAGVRTEFVRHVGGFAEWPIYEDYDLWLRLWRIGARIGRAPDAVYRAHVAPRSRNTSLPTVERKRIAEAIQRAAVAP